MWTKLRPLELLSSIQPLIIFSITNFLPALERSMTSTAVSYTRILKQHTGRAYLLFPSCAAYKHVSSSLSSDISPRCALLFKYITKWSNIIKSGTRRQSVVLDSNLTWISIYFYSLRVKWLDGDESQFPCNAKANVKQAQESYGMLHQKKMRLYKQNALKHETTYLWTENWNIRLTSFHYLMILISFKWFHKPHCLFLNSFI